MSVLSKGTTFATNQQVTATTLNNLVDNATFASGAVDNTTTQLSGGAIIVKDGGVTPAKLSAGGPSWDSSSNLTVTGDVSVGDDLTVTDAATIGGLLDISGASAGQIKFPATQNASANANTLDDYEEGTWTPSLGGTATYNAQVGVYTKIGRLVTVTGEVHVNSIGTGSTFAISGLPFTAANTFYEWPGSVSTWTGAVSNFVFVGFRVLGNTTTGEFTCAAGAQSSCNTSTAVFTNGTYIYFTATYSV